VTSDERPHVLLVPGFLDLPPRYRPMADRLRARGAAEVAVAPVWTPDWLVANVTGFGGLMRRVGRAVVRAHQRAGGRPLIVIGHSAGGLLARLAMSPEPFRGRRAGVAEAYGALVTLGTPHGVGDAAERSFRAAFEAIRHLDATIPGAWFAPRTAYLTVGSRCIRGGPLGAASVGVGIAGFLYGLLGGAAARTAWGDGVIVEATTHLEGARNVTLEGLIHGPGLPVPWYGSDEGLDGWWDLAVEAWRDALRARDAG
jgi:hypothetical protein